MKSTLRGQNGMSLVEATIILMVLMLLTGVLAPSMFDFVNDAKHVKVKEDCEVIGVTVMRMVRDVGSCLKLQGWERCTLNNRADILFSDGPDVTQDDLNQDTTADFNNQNIASGNINWTHDDGSNASWMEHQFVTNESGPWYPTPGDSIPPGWVNPLPAFNLGWRGAYVSPPIGPDPWGHRYLVNSVFLSVAVDAENGQGEGERNGGWARDTLCISAGANNLFDTPIGGSGGFGTKRTNDDFVYVISGDTR